MTLKSVNQAAIKDKQKLSEIPRFLADQKTYELVVKQHEHKMACSNSIDKIGQSLKKRQEYLSEKDEINFFVKSTENY